MQIKCGERLKKEGVYCDNPRSFFRVVSLARYVDYDVNSVLEPGITHVYHFFSIRKITMAETRNIFLVGPMGAGKSTIGRQLAQQLKMDFLDSDAVIEERAGADISWIFDLEGEEGFRKREEKIINELTQMQGIVLSTGGGAIMSKENRNYLSARGIVIYLQTTVDKQYQRTQRDKNRPLLQGAEDPRQVLEDLAKIRNPLYEEVADITLPTDEQNAKVMVNQIVDLIDNLNGLNSSL